jgi:hypothetical protein
LQGCQETSADSDESNTLIERLPNERKLCVIEIVTNIVCAHEDDVQGWAGCEAILFKSYQRSIIDLHQ